MNEGMAEKPFIETTRNTFKIILPNRNVRKDTGDVSVSKVESETVYEACMKKPMDDREEQIMGYAREHSSLTKNDVADLLQVRPSTAVRLIRGLVKRNLLKCNGKARSTYYTIIK